MTGDSHVSKKRKTTPSLSKDDLEVLATIDKRKLDFDSEKICSVSLSKMDTFGCLVCGKYFKGCSERTPAFLHAVNDGHRVFVGFYNADIVVLPEGRSIQVTEGKPNSETDKFMRLLRNIKYSVNPTYTRESIATFPRRCLDSAAGRPYYNGFVGLTKSTSSNTTFITTVLHALAHIPPVRDYMLLVDSHDNTKSALMQRLSIVVKKLWSPHLFKLHVGPDEFINNLLVEHPGVMEQGSADPKLFFNWLVNALCKQDKALKKILRVHCQGKLNDAVGSKHIPFWNLTLRLPETSMFKDGRDINEQPQIELEKLVGDRFISNAAGPSIEASGLPHYLVLNISRFENGEFRVKSRNQTIVSFSERLELTLSGRDEPIQYKLCSNIVHDPKKNIYNIEKDDESTWKVQVPNTSTHEWVEMDSTTTTTRDINLLFLNESYLQVWERI